MEYQLTVLFIALLFSALFSGVEIAFISSNRLKVELDKSSNKLNGRIVSYFYKKEGTFLSVLTLGNNLALVTFGLILAALIKKWLLEHFAFEHQFSLLLIQISIATFIALLFIEFIPKLIFQFNPNKSLATLAVPTLIAYWVLYLPTSLLLLIGSLFFKSLRFDKINEKKPFSKADLEEYVSDLHLRINEDEGIGKEVQILQNALDFDRVKARECMIPRLEIIGVDQGEKMDVVREKFIETGISKMIVFDQDMDSIIGYIHVFEMFKNPTEISEVMRPIEFVSEETPGKELLQLFTKKSANIAAVVDEYGGTAGVVTIEDVIEKIFGEIEDEHDIDTSKEERLNDHEYRFSGRTEIEYLNQNYQLNLPESDEYETLGGMIIYFLATIPEAGEQICIRDYDFIIEEVSDRKIETVRLVKQN